MENIWGNLQAQVEYFLVATWLHNFWGLHLASFDFLRSPPECRELILGGTDLRVCLEQHKWRWPIFRNQSYEWSISRISLYPHNYIQSSFTTKNVIRQQCFCLLTDLSKSNIWKYWKENLRNLWTQIFNSSPHLSEWWPVVTKRSPQLPETSPQLL